MLYDSINMKYPEKINPQQEDRLVETEHFTLENRNILELDTLSILNITAMAFCYVNFTLISWEGKKRLDKTFARALGKLRHLHQNVLVFVIHCHTFTVKINLLNFTLDNLFSVFCDEMGHRHKVLPLHTKV